MRILLLLISATLLLSSCMSRNTDAPETPTGPDGQNTQAPIVSGPSYSEILEKTSSKISDTAEFQACMAPSVKMCVTQVGNELARKMKSTDFCNEMPDDSARDACKYGVVMVQAAESGDVKLCESLSATYKESCMTSMIMQSARTSGDVTQCDALAGSGQSDRKDQCYTTVITQNPASTASDCEKIGGEREKTMCVNLMKSRSEREINQ